VDSRFRGNDDLFRRSRSVGGGSTSGEKPACAPLRSSSPSASSMGERRGRGASATLRKSAALALTQPSSPSKLGGEGPGSSPACRSVETFKLSFRGLDQVRARLRRNPACGSWLILEKTRRLAGGRGRVRSSGSRLNVHLARRCLPIGPARTDFPGWGRCTAASDRTAAGRCGYCARSPGSAGTYGNG